MSNHTHQFKPNGFGSDNCLTCGGKIADHVTHDTGNNTQREWPLSDSALEFAAYNGLPMFMAKRVDQYTQRLVLEERLGTLRSVLPYFDGTYVNGGLEYVHEYIKAVQSQLDKLNGDRES